MNREFDEMGAHYNAFTSEENTVYYAAVLPEYQEPASWSCWPTSSGPPLREEDFDTEKQVIIEEIQMYEDQPPFGADDKCRAAHFGAHPLGRSVLGTVAEHRRPCRSRRCATTSPAATPGQYRAGGGGTDRFRRPGGHGRESLRRLGAGSPPIARCRGLSTKAGFEVLAKASATQEYVLEMCRRPVRHRRRSLRRQAAGHDARRRLGQPAVLGTGRSGPGRACQPASLRIHGGRRVHDLHELRSGIRRRQSAAGAQGLSTSRKESFTAAELAQAKSKINSRIVLGSERPRGRLFAVGDKLDASARVSQRGRRSGGDRRRDARRRGRGAGPLSAQPLDIGGHRPARIPADAEMKPARSNLGPFWCVDARGRESFSAMKRRLSFDNGRKRLPTPSHRAIVADL